MRRDLILTIPNLNHEININILPSGIYFIKAVDNIQTTIKKILCCLRSSFFYFHATSSLLKGIVIHLAPPPPLDNSEPSIVITQLS